MLVKCPTCKNNISDEAIRCPKCGAKYVAPYSGLATIIVFVVVVIFAICVA